MNAESSESTCNVLLHKTHWTVNIYTTSYDYWRSKSPHKNSFVTSLGFPPSRIIVAFRYLSWSRRNWHQHQSISLHNHNSDACKRHEPSRIEGPNLLGYVRGIFALSSSPSLLLIGGTMAIMTGPTDPITMDQKMAGFSCEAHRM